MTTSQDNILLAKQFGMIFTEYYSVVKYFAFMLLKSEEDAEDIAQDVFTKLWTQPEIWTKVPNLKPYVYTLTKSTTLNFIKHKKIELAYQEKVIALLRNFLKQKILSMPYTIKKLNLSSN